MIINNYKVEGEIVKDYIIINLNKLSNNLDELSKQVKELIF